MCKARRLPPYALLRAFIQGTPSSSMDFELHPQYPPQERSFNVLVAPREHFIAMINRNLNLRRYKVLFVTGNCSGSLSRLHRRFTDSEELVVNNLPKKISSIHHQNCRPCNSSMS
ncbi:MAG: hypothetical protein LUQ22_05590 [Methanotrichaceae archaeon]|nr:hypothetical protein [Methanotrichaceae archaeon]